MSKLGEQANTMNGQLPPAVILGHKFSVNDGGTKRVGALVASDRGLGVQAEFTEGRMKKRRAMIRRVPLVDWEQVTGYEITSQMNRNQFGGSTVSQKEVTDLILHTASKQLAYHLEMPPARLRNLLGSYLAAIDNGSDPAPAGPPTGGVSVADELAKLAQLRDGGVLSDDEFAAQKAKLLS